MFSYLLQVLTVVLNHWLQQLFTVFWMEELSFEASFPETLVVWMSRLQSLLTENSKGNLIPLNELRDVLENDVQLWRDGDGKIDAGLLELFNLQA